MSAVICRNLVGDEIFKRHGIGNFFRISIKALNDFRTGFVYEDMRQILDTVFAILIQKIDMVRINPLVNNTREHTFPGIRLFKPVVPCMNHIHTSSPTGQVKMRAHFTGQLHHTDSICRSHTFCLGNRKSHDGDSSANILYFHTCSFKIGSSCSGSKAYKCQGFLHYRSHPLHPGFGTDMPYSLSIFFIRLLQPELSQCDAALQIEHTGSNTGCRSQ